MMKKCVAWLLVLLLIPSIVGATTWFSCTGDTFCGSSLNQWWGTIDLASGQSSPSGSTNVWRWTFKNGTPGGEGIASVYPASSMPNGAQEMWLQYYWKYSPGFQYHGVGTKQIYFKPNNIIGAAISSDGHFGMAPQGGSGASINHWPNVNTSTWYFSTGVWHKYKARFKWNSPGQSNGIYQLWIDDILVSNYLNVIYGDYGEGLTEGGLGFVVIWGGAGGVISGTHYFYVSGVYIGSTDPDGGGLPPLGKAPFPPSRLSIQ